MKRIEIFWNDLTKKKQEEIRETLQLDPGDDNNWTYFPMTVMEIEEEDEWIS